MGKTHNGACGWVLGPQKMQKWPQESEARSL